MMMKSRLTSLLAAALLIGSGYAYAQGYDDDDIYYNPAKAKATKPVTKQGPSQSATTTADYPAADTYTYNGSGLNVDIDTYNRRGTFAPDTAVSMQQESTSNFEYTQQIERFYNPRVVIESPDAEVARYYYAEPSADVNIIINTPGYWGYPYYAYSPYYYSSPWYWGTPRSWWYYNSWYYDTWAWGPYWNWGPSWAWGPSWGWGGYYHPIWHPSHSHHPTWANRPSGNVRPGYRPGSSRGRYSYSTGGNYGNTRPSFRPGSSSNYRPSAGSSPSYRPGQSNGNSSGYRSGNGTGRSNGSNSYSRPNNNSNRSSSSPSYRSGSGSSRGSAGSYSGGSRSGGSHSGGGGRGRH